MVVRRIGVFPVSVCLLGKSHPDIFRGAAIARFVSKTKETIRNSHCLILCTIIIAYLDISPEIITILMLCDLSELPFAQHSGTDTPLRIILPLQLPQPEGASDIRARESRGDDVFQRVACRFAVDGGVACRFAVDERLSLI